MLNIAMLSEDYPPVLGGISNHVYELSKAVSALGHHVTVLTRYDPSRDIEKYGSTLKDLYQFKLRLMAPTYGLQVNRFIRRCLPVIQPDLIHVHGMGPLEWCGVKSLPLVYTNHTSGYLRRIKKGGFRRMYTLRRIFRKPRLFLAPSKELLQIPFPVDAEKEFIPNGVDSAKYKRVQGDRARIREQLGFQDEDIVGILTRRLVKKNGVIYLARAAGHIKNQHIRFLLIGDGDQRDSVEKVFQQHFPHRFLMLGAMPPERIVPYYSAADFSVLPSLMEATSISGLEAMAASLPIVGTHVGGIPEFLIDGETGFLCKPADPEDLATKIDLLATKVLSELGAKARNTVEQRFAWQRIAAQTVEAYKKIL
jgi:glycosyltransferase involved in cell wall biosynthesis